MSPHRKTFQAWWRGRTIHLLFFGAGATSVALGGSLEIFNGPPAAYVSPPPVATPAAGVLRWIWVQERAQVQRRGAAVRAPIFFAAGECHDPAELAVVRWPSRQRVPVQMDDVRRQADGGVARLHLWFTTEIGAGETQRWALIKRNPAEAEGAPSVTTSVAGQELQVRCGGTQASFFLDLTRHGPLSSLQLDRGPVLAFPDGAGAVVTLRDAKGTDDTVTPRNAGAVEWASGPVFAKVVARTRGRATACAVEQVYRIFSDGSMNICQSITPSEIEEPLTVKAQEFLSGRVLNAENLSVHPQSAGMVESLIDVHPGYQVDDLLAAEQSRGWMVVPGALGGNAGRLSLEHRGAFRLLGPDSITSGEGDARPRTVRAFWSEITLYPAEREGPVLARNTLLAAAQPLVAVVDWPGVEVATATARIADNVRELKPVGWVNETVVRQLNGRTLAFPKRNWKLEETPAHWMGAAQKANEKVTGGNRRPAEDEKGRAAGPLDPYHLTYGTTGLAYWLLRDEVPPGPRASLRAQLEAVRRQLGRTDEQGWPYLDVFSRTQNMQMGPPFLALADREADPDLRQFYRDQLSAPQLAAVMLRGFRPYEGRSQTGPVPSDELYQGVVDFYLRATELALNESLAFHPVAFGRYLDAIDVNADLYHPAHARAAEQGDGFAHANFFRMQSHLHRWLNWGPAPFIALLQRPAEEGLVPGSTEAWYFADAMVGHWKNWPDQSWLFLAAELPSRTVQYSPAPRPAPRPEVHVRRGGTGNRLAWVESSGATAYRIYRLRPGQPPVWLNSPYSTTGGTNRSVLAWDDAGGKAEDRYRVHVVDSAGQESSW